MHKRLLQAAVLLFLQAAAVSAINLWRYSETAEKNTWFLGGAAAVSLTGGIEALLPEFHIDYMLPVGLPFSLGAYFKTPAPNLKSFGLRAGYHIDLDNEYADLYAVYVFDFGFVRNTTLIRHGDEAQDIRWFDFRAGIRWRFGRFMCMYAETGWKLQSMYFGISVKLN
jgi:hypothetical protein